VVRYDNAPIGRLLLVYQEPVGFEGVVLRRQQEVDGLAEFLAILLCCEPIQRGQI